MLATSYPGFWLLPVIGVLLIGALPLGIFGIVSRRRKIAVGSGAVYLLFGAWTIALGVSEGGDDLLSSSLFGGAFILVGLLLSLVRRGEKGLTRR